MGLGAATAKFAMFNYISGILLCVWCVLMLLTVLLKMGPFKYKPVIPVMCCICYACLNNPFVKIAVGAWLYKSEKKKDKAKKKKKKKEAKEADETGSDSE